MSTDVADVPLLLLINVELNLGSNNLLNCYLFDNKAKCLELE